MKPLNSLNFQATYLSQKAEQFFV